MWTKGLSVVFILLNVWGCKTIQQFDSPMSAQNYGWQINFNAGVSSEVYYTEKAGLFFNNQFTQGKEAIDEELSKLRAEIKGIKFLGSIKQIEHSATKFLDVGLFKDEDKQNHAFLIAWKKEDDLWKKELEIFYPFNKNLILPEAEIAAARETWERLSNSHDHRALIEQSYTSDAVYFNNEKVDIGRKAIVSRYAYMSDPAWQIALTPIQLLAVQEDLVYEIGTYKSNGVGHYVIVWEKQENDVWQARLDFNF